MLSSLSSTRSYRRTSKRPRIALPRKFIPMTVFSFERVITLGYPPVYPTDMPVQYTVTLSKVGNSYRVVIPKPAIKGLKWQLKDKLNLLVKDDSIVITKSLVRAEDTLPKSPEYEPKESKKRAP